MRIGSLFFAGCLLLSPCARLRCQTAVEHGTIAAGAGSATTDSKKISKSIGDVFNRIGKGLGGRTREQHGRQAPATTSAVRPAASGKNRQPASKLDPARVVSPSQIRIGMSREELFSAVGQPSVQISATDEEGFAETYMYRGEAGTVTVTLHGGKVSEVSPMPPDSTAAPALAVPPQTQSMAERP